MFDVCALELDSWRASENLLLQCTNTFKRKLKKACQRLRDQAPWLLVESTQPMGQLIGQLDFYPYSTQRHTHCLSTKIPPSSCLSLFCRAQSPDNGVRDVWKVADASPGAEESEERGRILRTAGKCTRPQNSEFFAI